MFGLGFSIPAVAARRPGKAAGASVPATLRHVASRTYPPNTRDATRTQIMSRSGHKNRGGLTASSMQIAIPNWYLGTGGVGEASSGGAATFTASIEYPSSVYTQVTFGGATSGAAAANTTLFSDMITLSTPIPDGADFWVNIYGLFESAIVFTYKFSSAAGDKGQYGTSGVVDTTMSPWTSSTSITLRPCLILAMGTRPATLVLGDSRCYGTGGTAAETGEIEPTLAAAGRPYVNAGIYGALSSQATTAHRQEMAAYFQSLVFELGINDVTAGKTLTDYQRTIANMRARSGFAGLPMVMTTKPPVSTSTDNWLTLVNQTTHATNSVRVAINNWIRTDPYGDGYFEIADIVESSRDSGLWAADGVTAKKFNSDGTHENDVGYAAIAASGAINLALLDA